MQKSNLNICFIGGDKRQKYAAEKLSNYANINAVGKCFCNTLGINPFESPMKAMYRADVIVLPLPAATVEDTADFTNIVEYARNSGALIIGGMFSEYMKDAMDELNVTYIDFYEDEGLTVRNAYITAEGALNIAMQYLETSIINSRFAVIGYGRIGSALADILKANKGDVTAYARRREALILAEERGIKGKQISSDDRLEYDVIFNTVPSRVISNEQILGLGRDTILIELASAPGGFDFEIAEQSGLKTIKAGGLPGKYAPVTAGYAVADTILTILEREALL